MTLIVPEYVLRQREAKKKADEATKELSLKDRVPKPTGWRILVMPYMGKEKTEGGIHVPDSVREKEARRLLKITVGNMNPLSITANKQGRDISLRNEFLNWLSPKNRRMAENLEKTFQVKRRRYESIIKNPEYKRRFSIYAY